MNKLVYHHNKPIHSPVITMFSLAYLEKLNILLIGATFTKANSLIIKILMP